MAEHLYRDFRPSWHRKSQPILRPRVVFAWCVVVLGICYVMLVV